MSCVPYLTLVLVVIMSLPIGPAYGGASVQPTGLLDIEEQLEVLDPSMPEAYFTLGEELAAEARTEQDYKLVQRLYLITILQSHDQPNGATLAASACIALADTARADADRRVLWAIARMLDPRYSIRDWSRSTDVVVTDDVAFETATALGHIRSGWGSRAVADLRRDDVQRLIRRYSALITGTIQQNILPELERQAKEWPCPECRNDRVVTKRHTGRIERRLCYTCGGNPGPEMTPDELIGQLRFESFLLNSRQRSWGAQVAADLGEPMRDPEIGDLALRFGVDPKRVLYRNGQWVEPLPTESHEDADDNGESDSTTPEDAP